MERYIEEIKEYKNDPTPKAALRIYSILESNQKAFLKKMDENVFSMFLKSYEELANAHPTRYFSQEYKDEYNRLHSGLSYHLERIF